VIAHQKKSMGGGLPQLRTLIAGEHVDDLRWYEVPKSRKAPEQARKALEDGVDLVFVWGGDGMVQRCADVFAGSAAAIAIVPAGTANLLAANLGIPQDLAEAVRIGFAGRRRRLDLGEVNGEHFAVMAGAGFDAEMIRDTGRALKKRAGRLAYVWTGLRHVRDGVTPMQITVDGEEWFAGDASCVLLGNVGTIIGGIRAFDDARPDDGWLAVGVTTARGPLEWARTLARVMAGHSTKSPFVQITKARRADVSLSAPRIYELDGGARDTTTRLTARIDAAALTVCVPN
jgi:YegS/Rv2252/BmrU family lipid kinase